MRKDDGDEPKVDTSRETSYLNRREAANERARTMRREAYQRAKDITKAQKIERQNSPEANERKLRLREQRRQAYLKAKEAYKKRVEERRVADRERELREAAEAEALRDEELMKTLTPADKLPPKQPRLRLVKNDE